MHIFLGQEHKNTIWDGTPPCTPNLVYTSERVFRCHKSV